jgi:hypothetical protein
MGNTPEVCRRDYPYEVDNEDEYDFLFGDGFQVYDGDNCPPE